MDYKEKYEQAIKRANAILEVADNREEAFGYVSTIFPELAESGDERIRKAIYNALKYLERQLSWDFLDDVDILDAYDWLEKQKVTDEEVIFRPVVGTDIRIAAKQALEKIDIGKKVVLAFNGAYIPVNGKTVGEIDSEYDAWLEKQDKQLYTDKAEPKFHEGDWVVDSQGFTYQIELVVENVTTHTFGYDIVGGGYFNDNNKDIHLWTIQDAKDGDVLASGGLIFIFNKIHGVWINCHCSLHKDNSFNNECYDLMHVRYEKEVYPATKEQLDTLFTKMREAGYEWDVDKKELKKIRIIDEGKDEMDYCFTKMMNGEKVSPTWSEEDEEMCKIALSCVETLEDISNGKNMHADVKDWLKSLKERLSKR